jgi:RNA polymerase sigma-70 factor (ECF subfamily)
MLYLFGIARHLTWKSARRDRWFAVLDHDRELAMIDSSDLASDLARQEQVKTLKQAILSLPRKYREVIVLCSLQELSYEEAATVIDSSIGTVRSRMHRAKQLLARKLNEGELAQGKARGGSVLRYGL